MIERKHTYEFKAQAAAARRLASILPPVKPEGETEQTLQASLNRSDFKIDLLNRLIKHLKTL